ncbi:LuxR C-terminal-related transcriptional regulator [Sphingomonas sp. AOB5]|uniref:helix-turn-helix transcriptional regulator n=1 Tax=Sphingomonas sp. AOB5 TaxID=3034017 RepID=UPI0023F6F816|nr:LuxR C-terminal-related transcriptional regulator [Sphingomonas sp. AOB5]MDF7775522.1 LuxR C-terminal-related transcriptional regulator [Sphingomonas sp. AOB5]
MPIRDALERGHYENLKLCLKALDVGLWDYDIDSGQLSCDARWYELVGLPLGSIRSVAEFRPHIHPDDADLATNADPDMIMAMIARDERYHIDFRVMTGGAFKWIRSVACLLVDPATGHRRAVGCITDNSEFRLIEPSLTPAAGQPDPAEAEIAEEEPDAHLSSKELECLSWVSVGKTAWETAIIMDRSQRTVEFHLVNAVRKLSAANKIHAAVIAIRRGLI